MLKTESKIFFSLFYGLLIFFKNQLFRKILSGIESECQTVWIQIRPDVSLGLIWVQSVCKSYQQTTLGDIEVTQNVADFGFNYRLILSWRQIVWTQIRLFHMEQSDTSAHHKANGSSLHIELYLPAVCPNKVVAHCPVLADQIFSCISEPPLRTTIPEGKNLHVYTSP